MSVVESYDPVLDQWLPGPSMTTERGFLSCASWNDTLFAIGGHDSSYKLSSVERFDPRVSPIRSLLQPNSFQFNSQEGKWVLVAPMSTKRCSHAAFSLGDHVYVTGGRRGTYPFDGMDTCEAFDPRADCWQPMAPMLEKR